jgi:hypothetical protein
MRKQKKHFFFAKNLIICHVSRKQEMYMPKIVFKNADIAKRRASMDKVKKVLKEDNAGYVLITCSNPSINGMMNVELSYEGDDALASYLLESANNLFQQKAPPCTE